MKKVSISLIAISLAMPALADPVTPNIAVGTNPASCTESVLETTSGTSNLEANWTANTLNLKWYDDENGNEITPTNPAAASCTYDSGITVPTNNPTKTGYTFAGWKVKTSVASCGLSSWDFGERINDGAKNFIVSEYSGNDTGLNNGEWFITTSTGTVKGIATCNNTAINMETLEAQMEAGTITMEEAMSMMIRSGDTFNQNSTGENCWCKVLSLNNTTCSVSETFWVVNFLYTPENTQDCMEKCATACVYPAMGAPLYRQMMFGQPLTSE